MFDSSYEIVPEEEEENEESQALLITNVQVCGAGPKSTSILVAGERLITLDEEAAESAAAALGSSRCPHLDGTVRPLLC